MLPIITKQIWLHGKTRKKTGLLSIKTNELHLPAFVNTFVQVNLTVSPKGILERGFPLSVGLSRHPHHFSLESSMFIANMVASRRTFAKFMQGECGLSECNAKLKAKFVLTLSIFKAPVLFWMNRTNVPIWSLC